MIFKKEENPKRIMSDYIIPIHESDSAARTKENRPIEIQSQSLTGKSIAMHEPCTIPLHCSQLSKLKIRLLSVLLDSLCGMTTSA